MKSQSQSCSKIAIALLLVSAISATAQMDSVPRLELTSLANLDLGGEPMADRSPADFPIELADAEIQTTLRWSQMLQARAILVHQDGLATFEEAFAIWSKPGLEVAFGKQTLPLGSYPGRLIHDPLLQADLETIAPSLLLSKALGLATIHLALASHSLESDSGDPFPTTGAVGALDLEGPASTNLRLSGRILRELRLFDLGVQARRGNILLDLEGYLADGAWARGRWAALAGLSWNATETFRVATRFDAREGTHPADRERSVAFGIHRTFARWAFLEAEWLQSWEGDGVLTMRLGWEAPLSIP